MAQRIFKDSEEMAAALILAHKSPVITGYRPVRGADMAVRRWFDMAAEAVTNQATQAKNQADFNLIDAPNTLADRWHRAIDKANTTTRFR